MFNLGIKFRRRITDLEAKLAGVNGFTGGGEVEFSAWRDGSRQIEVELYGVAGRVAELYINGEKVKSLGLDNGRGNEILDTKHGDCLPEAIAGAEVEIRQNGQAILTGIMQPD